MARKKTDIVVEKRVSLEDETFVDKHGKRIRLFDVIDKETDCWLSKNKKSNLWILTHRAVEKIAIAAGIDTSFDVQESANTTPTYQNELEHIVRVTITCKTKPTGGCVHSDNNEFTVTGESNRINTPHRGRGYLRKMAEKRGFDIAVLKHLGLYTSVFSEDEAEEFQEDEKDHGVMPGSKDFELIVEELNLILNASTKPELKAAGKVIKARVAEGKFSDRQLKYLRGVYKNSVTKFVTTF